MDDDLKAVVERLSQSATFAEETGRNRCDSILASDLRTLLSALRQRDEALERAEAEIALLDEVCARYADDEDACLDGRGEPFGSITVECGMKARTARHRFKEREAARTILTEGETNAR